MRPLHLHDKCYKFFPSMAKSEYGSGSIVYQANKYYSDAQLYFFKKDEAITSLKSLYYFMNHGDCLVEIVVDDSLIESAVEASPDHFASGSFTTGGVYDIHSNEMLSLILESLRRSEDFSGSWFKDIIVKLIEYQGFDTAAIIYNTIIEDRSLKLSTNDFVYIRDMSRQSLRNIITKREIDACTSFEDYIILLKSKKP